MEVSAENLIVEVGNQQKIKPSTMSKDTKKAVVGLSGVGLGLDDLVRHGARQVIQQAIEAQLSELVEQFANVKTLQGQRAVVRNGYLPEREVFAGTLGQRCWFHKMGNVLNALPKSQQARAKAGMQSIWMAATRADAHA